MRIRFLSSLAVIAVALGVAASAPSNALNSSDVSAVYAGNGVMGVISVTGPATTLYIVGAEQPNGTYASVAAGVIGVSGVGSTFAMGSGVPGNGLPAFIVTFPNAPGLPFAIGVPGPYDDDLWGWE